MISTSLMVRRAGVVAAFVAGAALAPGAGSAQVRIVPLPDPGTPLTAQPPLASAAQPLPATNFTSTLRASTLVRVGIAPEGEPVSLVANQRLEVGGSGDYAFIIRAPATDVRPGPGTQSRPGFRRGAIVWQGFSPGRRTLSAVATLARAAARQLPLAVSLRASVDGEVLRPGERRSGRLVVLLEVENRTATTAGAFAGAGIPAQLARVLDEARKAVASGRSATATLVSVAGYEEATYPVDAGLRVSGELEFPVGRLDSVRVTGGRAGAAAGRVRFAATVGGGRPRHFIVRISGRATAAAAPSVHLQAEAVRDVPGLRPPGGGTWTGALERPSVANDGRRLLATTVETFLRLARVAQYGAFLQNPHPAARSDWTKTRYLYRTVAAAPVPSRGSSGGDGTGGFPTALLAAGIVLALGAGIVVWAHL